MIASVEKYGGFYIGRYETGNFKKEIENYDLVEVPSNASGTMVEETDEEGNIINNRTMVEYYYTQRAIVEEHHIDCLLYTSRCV